MKKIATLSECFQNCSAPKSKVFFVVLVCFISLVFSQVKGQNYLIVGNGTSNGGSNYTFTTDQKETTAITEFNHDRGSFSSSFLEVDGHFWSTLTFGGSDEQGVLFKIDDNAENYQVIRSFNLTEGSSPNGHLIELDDRIWGTTSKGGDHGWGTIFSVHKNGTGFHTEHNFSFDQGGLPNGPLLYHDDKLWGVTENGGAGDGVVYSIDKYGLNFQVIHEFNGSEGSKPVQGLHLFENELWGVTNLGGTEDQGVIYKINPQTNEFTSVYKFNTTSGKNPETGLTVQNGKLWGATRDGGSNDQGIIFSLAPSGGGVYSYQVKHNFNDIAGMHPSGNLLVFDNALWGTTRSGGDKYEGAIFKLSNDGNNYEVIYSYQSNNNAGRNSNLILGDLIVDVEQTIWGMAYEEIFNLATTNSNQFSVRGNFFNRSGGAPDFGFTKIEDRLWGVDGNGGDKNLGIVYSMYLDGSDRRVHYSFSTDDVFNPQGSVTLVGQEAWGVSNSELYAININDYSFRTIDIVSSGVDLPKGDLLLYDGFLYGLAESGGAQGKGCMYAVNIATDEVSVIFGFQDQVRLHQPVLIVDGGVIYGGVEYVNYMEKFGGIFSYNVATDTYSELYESLVVAPVRGVKVSDNLIWGLAHDQQVDGDVIFRMNPDGSNFSAFHSIDAAIGDNVSGGLTKAGDRFWGQVFRGGTNGYGAIFSFNPDVSGNNYEVQKELNLTADIGGNPSGALFVTEALSNAELNVNLPEVVFLDQLPFDMNVTSNSDGAITYEVLSGTADVSNGAINSANRGSVQLRVSQSASSTHFATAFVAAVDIKDYFDLQLDVDQPNGQALASGMAQLALSSGTLFTEKEISAGSVVFSDIPEDEYYLKIIPASGDVDLFYPTYYDEALTWNNASLLNIDKNTALSTAILENDGSLPEGSGAIEGTVSEDEESGVRILNGRTASGPALEGISIFLINTVTGTTAGPSTTDQNGQFSFSNIPTGSYQVYIDIPGIAVGKGRVIEYSEFTGVLELNIGVGADGIDIARLDILDVEPKEISQLSVYPNPVNNVLHVSIGRKANSFSYRIIDLMGRAIETSTIRGLRSISDHQIIVSQLPKGLYLLEIWDDQDTELIKFIKD